MKFIIKFLIVSLLAFAGVNKANAAVSVFDKDNQLVEQTPGNTTFARIGTIYSGSSYKFTMTSSAQWYIVSKPTGLSFSVNNGTITKDGAMGNGGYSSVIIYADDNIQGEYTITLVVQESKNEYRYELLVLPKPEGDAKFSCPDPVIGVLPGDLKYITDAVSITVTGDPVELNPGQRLGTADNGNIWIEYLGKPQIYTEGTSVIPVMIYVRYTANPGTYEVALNEVPKVESECTWTITVNEPNCQFILNCAANTITPNSFKKGVQANSQISIPYTLTGCNSYIFGPINNITSTGVEGLILNLNEKPCGIGSGVIVGTITGTPVNSGTATFDIPGFCTISVEVQSNESILDILCNQNKSVNAYYKKALNVNMVTDYRLTDGTKEITAWRGTTVNGLYVEVPRQTVAAPSGEIKFSIKGTPNKVGTTRLSININNIMCYVDVVVKKSGSSCSHGSDNSTCPSCNGGHHSGGHH